MIDETHDPRAASWVSSANGHAEFPVQNLPWGLFSTAECGPRPGVAIGDQVLDVAPALADLSLPASTRQALEQSSLNALMELPANERRELRLQLFHLLTDPQAEAAARVHLHARQDCVLHLPVQVRNFTDFYSGIHHARAVGALFRPDNPLLPNYKYVPVAYHSRASSVLVSGAPVIRPAGQIAPAPDAPPIHAPCRRLDYEVELGIWMSGRSELGQPIPIAAAGEHIAGFCLLNDWSARDIQAWEYQPLGPFLAKSFATTVSPWIVTTEALAPFRCAQAARPEGDPAPLPYLNDATDQAEGAFDIRIDVSIRTARMREQGLDAFVLGRTTALHLYWTPAQMVAHHTVNGCDLAAGDLLGSGTISGPDASSCGSLLERSLNGRNPVDLPSGEKRTFIEDGDEILFTAGAEREGFARIGFGVCSARVLPAVLAP